MRAIFPGMTARLNSGAAIPVTDVLLDTHTHALRYLVLSPNGCKFHRRIQHFSSGEGSGFQALHTKGKEPPARVKERARRPGAVLLRRYNPC